MEYKPICAFFKVLSLYLEARIRIRIKVKGKIRIRIRVTSRIRIRNTVYKMHSEILKGLEQRKKIASQKMLFLTLTKQNTVRYRVP
jgi:hypothetical protein